MRRLERHREAVAVVAGLIVPVVVAAIIVPFRATFATTASALILVGVVVAVASGGSRAGGFVAALSASLWFDFFLTRPYEQFAITRRPDIETAISLFVVGVAVTEIAARNRHHHRMADEGSDYIGVVYYLSELVASGASAEQIIERAVAELTLLLHLRACRYEDVPSVRPVTRIEHDGTIDVGSLKWGADRAGLPGREVELVVQDRGETLGRFVLVPTPGWPVSLQRRVVAVAIADQVGASLAPRLRSA